MAKESALAIKYAKIAFFLVSLKGDAIIGSSNKNPPINVKADNMVSLYLFIALLLADARILYSFPLFLSSFMIFIILLSPFK
jgi:hypothetical protein